jgi:hypothetical protein
VNEPLLVSSATILFMNCRKRQVPDRWLAAYMLLFNEEKKRCRKVMSCELKQSSEIVGAECVIEKYVSTDALKAKKIV